MEGKRRGTYTHMAPEVFRDVIPPRTVKYDVYSFGILLWELLSGKKAFADGIDNYYLFVCLNNSYLLYKIYKGHIIIFISSLALRLFYHICVMYLCMFMQKYDLV